MNVGLTSNWRILIFLPLTCPPRVLSWTRTSRRLQAINHFHFDMVLHWLPGAHYICSGLLLSYQEHVSILFRTRGAKFHLSIRPNKIHPLETSSKNETVTTELNDAHVDFPGQIVEILQYYGDGFQRFEILEPVLAIFMLANTYLTACVTPTRIREIKDGAPYMGSTTS
ncbi:hypothetical protein DFJ58DRAFT_497329 [Suillus subalutaceus]|uniref:uncharacterized protein n=1 Tax=Suillus subalutaceus TaxID=48586 RepID=UPI001B85CA2D|nr:uncharacterized protein DFJ58DRAFT_497329 [Suillus subalutaceus]KAG1846380.1 hypothetical protein DFJ58DRAFT_497329 [Suillus subalutaceus]